MPVTPTFVGFSSTDICNYRLMQAWKAHEHIDFDFRDCQLRDALRSEDEQYIKRRCRERINMASAYVLLIGSDTKYKHKYVLWEAEVAVEKRCKIIGVNLDGDRFVNPDRCPGALRNVGALFVPFSAKIIAEALKKVWRSDNDWHFTDEEYTRLGYILEGRKAKPVPKPASWEMDDALKGLLAPSSAPYTPFDPFVIGWPTRPSALTDPLSPLPLPLWRGFPGPRQPPKLP